MRLTLATATLALCFANTAAFAPVNTPAFIKTQTPTKLDMAKSPIDYIVKIGATGALVGTLLASPLTASASEFGPSSSSLTTAAAIVKQVPPTTVDGMTKEDIVEADVADVSERLADVQAKKLAEGKAKDEMIAAQNIVKERKAFEKKTKTEMLAAERTAQIDEELLQKGALSPEEVGKAEASKIAAEEREAKALAAEMAAEKMASEKMMAEKKAEVDEQRAEVAELTALAKLDEDVKAAGSEVPADE